TDFNQYQSTNWYTVFYDLPANGLTNSISNLNIYLTNKLELSGPAELQVEYLRLDSDIGSFDDAVKMVMDSNVIPNQSTFVFEGSQLPQSSPPIDTLGRLGGQPPQVTYEMDSPSEYKVFVSKASIPFVLVVVELFYHSWQAQVGADRVPIQFTPNLSMIG